MQVILLYLVLPTSILIVLAMVCSQTSRVPFVRKMLGVSAVGWAIIATLV